MSERNLLVYLQSKATYLVSNPIKGKATYAIPIEVIKEELKRYETNNTNTRL